MQGRNFILKTVAVLSFFLGVLQAQGQGELYIFGVVKDYSTGKKLDNITISAYQNGQKVDSYTTSGNGKYEFFLDLGKEYEVKFDGPGLVSKKVYMDSRNIPEEDIGAGFSMNIEMSLFEEIEGLDITLLDKPIGKAKYNPNTGALEFDFAYTQEIKDELNRLMREWEKGAQDKLAQAEEKEKELAALEKEFEKLVATADGAFLKEKYQESVADYKEALKLKPENPMVLMKLKSAEEKLAEFNASRVDEEKYEAALKGGDDFMVSEEFNKAIAKYEEALEIKKDEKYPKDQIAAANAKIEALKKLEAENEQFNELVRKGDNLVKAMDFDEGIAKYNEALQLKPKNAEVEEKLKAAETAKADYLAQKAREKEYTDLIAQADAQFKSADFETAIASYESALGIKPEEQYPQDRIAEAQKKIEELQKELEAAEREKELEEQFNALVNQGDEHFSAEKYNDAISSYEEALVLKPGDSGVTKKIEDANTRLSQLAEMESLNQQYENAIKEGDAAQKSEQFTEALSSFEQAAELKPEEAYPQQKIKEIRDYLAEQERLAEEKRLEEERKKAEEQKLADELAQFNSLVESGDEFFSQKEYQKAIDQYQAALELKPDNKHLPNKIKESEKLLDELRKMQDVEQNYLEAIEEGDRKFTGKNYEGAIAAFKRAGELKPKESYPPERIAAAQQAIADLEKQKEEEALLAQQQEEEARLKELEAEQAKLRKEFDRIVASGDEFIAAKEYQNAVTRYNEALALIPDDQPVQQKLADAEQLLSEMLANRSLDKQFNMILADADALFKAEDFDRALAKYTEAQAVKPSDNYTAERITTIEEIIAARQEMSEKEKQAELEAQRKREEEEAERLRLAQQQQELEAIDEEYNTYIEVADRKMGQSEYDVALRNYQEALALKPNEFYPKSRIQEIELLIQEQEERRAEEERLAALEAERERNRGNKRRGGASVDSDTEDEAERFMREARLREEAEKYDRIKRLKKEQEERSLVARDNESERSQNYLQQVDEFKKHSDELYADASAAKQEVANRVKNYKKAVESEQQRDQERERSQIQKAQQDIEETEEVLQKIREGGEESRQKSVAAIDEKSKEFNDFKKEKRESEQDKNQKDYQNVQQTEENIQERHKEFEERRESVTAGVVDRKKNLEQQDSKRMQQEEKQIENAQKEVARQKKQKEDEKSVMDKIIKENSEAVETVKENNANRQKQASELAEIRAKKARENAFAVQANAPKDYDDYYLSQLAQEYPQGVTEESDNVGNKVIIRRIVVLGNKADEYRKVIDKTGKYYFKNGDSISELTWNRETNPQYD